jgi:Ger(x)C family germination protein
MRSRICIFIISILVACFLTGCWDAMEIADHTIVTFIGVDRIDDKVRFTLECKPSSEGIVSGKGNQSNILISEGNDFTQARNAYLRKSSHDVFLGAARELVFSDNFSRNGIEEYLNRLRGMAEYRRTITMFTTSTEINKLFTTKESSSGNIGYDIEHSADQLEEKGMIYNGRVSNILENISNPNTGFLLGNLEVINEGIEINGYSVFKNNKKIGFIPAITIKGANYLLLKKCNADYTVGVEDVSISISTHLKQKEIETKYDGENIMFNLKVSLNLEILYLSKEYRIDNEKTKALEKKLSDIVKRDILKAIETSQKDFECDYFYFYKYFRAKYNSDFKNMNWNERYKEAQFNVEVDAKVVPGNLVNFQ